MRLSRLVPTRRIITALSLTVLTVTTSFWPAGADVPAPPVNRRTGPAHVEVRQSDLTLGRSTPTTKQAPLTAGQVTAPRPGELIPMEQHAVHPLLGSPKYGPGSPAPAAATARSAAPPPKTAPLPGLPLIPPSQAKPRTGWPTPAPRHNSLVPAAEAAVTIGSVSQDFRFKLDSVEPGQSGPPTQTFTDSPGCVWCWSYSYAPLGGSLFDTPAIGTWYDWFWVVGVGLDHNLWFSYASPSTGWQGWYYLGFPGPATGSFYAAPAVVQYGSQFHIIANANGQLWDLYVDRTDWTWHGWTPLIPAGQGTAYGAPAVTPYTGLCNPTCQYNELHVAYVNNSPNRELMWLIFNPHWYGPAWVGPYAFASGPWDAAPALNQYGEWLQFWSLLGSGLWQISYNYSAAQWFNLATDAGSAPAVALMPGGYLEVFYVRSQPAGDWTVHEWVFDPVSAWVDRGYWGGMSSAPSLAVYGTYLQAWWRDFWP